MGKFIFAISVITAGVIAVFSMPVCANAYQVEQIPWLTAEGDFILGPAKNELWLDPGDAAKRWLNITNRTGKKTTFVVQVEDFQGSRDIEQTVVLMGDEKGPYSLRDWIIPEVSEFSLEQGERITLEVNVSVPEDAEPGGHYGAVIVSTKPFVPEGEEIDREVRGGVALASRIGALFFLRVKGPVAEEGFLKEFKTIEDKTFFERGPRGFQITFENNGDVHLVLYGVIEIKNVLGMKVDEIEVDPYFAMPNSLRWREVDWPKGFLLGYYKAALSLNRGYQDLVDQKSAVFYVLPWKIVTPVGVGLLVIILLLIWIIKNFEIRKKPDSGNNQKPVIPSA